MFNSTTKTSFYFYKASFYFYRMYSFFVKKKRKMYSFLFFYSELLLYTEERGARVWLSIVTWISRFILTTK